MVGNQLAFRIKHYPLQTHILITTVLMQVLITLLTEGDDAQVKASAAKALAQLAESITCKYSETYFISITSLSTPNFNAFTLVFFQARITSVAMTAFLLCCLRSRPTMTS